MRIGRTIPPAMNPLTLKNFFNGLKALVDSQSNLDDFKKSICRHFRTPHCYLVSSGAAALVLILKALRELEPSRNCVVIPAYTCYSVPSAIKQAGLEIYPCDIDPHTLDFDRSDLAAAVTSFGKRILAVIPTHLFGVPADVKSTRAVIGQEAIFVIEDAAQAMGAKGDGSLLGCGGDASFFSLGRGKAISTMGGGVIITRSRPIADALAKQVMCCAEAGWMQIVRQVLVTIFILLFSKPALFWLPKAIPLLKLGETIYHASVPIQKLSPFQAGLAKGWTDRLAAAQHIRQAIAQVWEHIVHQIGIETVIKQSADLSNLIRYPIYINGNVQRKQLMDASERQGLGIMPGYPQPVTRIPELRKELGIFKCVNAQTIAKSLVTLPMHANVNAGDRRRIALALVKEFTLSGDRK